LGKSSAPFDVHLIALNLKNEIVVAGANKIYDELQQNGVRVLFDDRDAAPVLSLMMQICSYANSDSNRREKIER